MEMMAWVYMAWAQPLSYIWIWFAIASHEGYEKTKVMFSGFPCITRMDGRGEGMKG